jgi:hypothetical protein
MALTQRTIVGQVEVQRDGTLQVRLHKQILNGDEVKSDQYHRMALPPGVPLAYAMKTVNAHLESMGEAAVGDEEIARIARLVEVEHTPEAVAAYAESLKAQEAAAEPEL